MADDLSVLRDMIRKIREMDRPLITIDGPCASGKTTLASRLAEMLDAAVIHTDDFVIPHALKTEKRLAVPGGNCDSGRLAREVCVPWRAGLPVPHRRPVRPGIAGRGKGHHSWGRPVLFHRRRQHRGQGDQGPADAPPG